MASEAQHASSPAQGERKEGTSHTPDVGGGNASDLISFVQVDTAKDAIKERIKSMRDDVDQLHEMSSAVITLESKLPEAQRNWAETAANDAYVAPNLFSGDETKRALYRICLQYQQLQQALAMKVEVSKEVYSRKAIQENLSGKAQADLVADAMKSLMETGYKAGKEKAKEFIDKLNPVERIRKQWFLALGSRLHKSLHRTKPNWKSAAMMIYGGTNYLDNWKVSKASIYMLRRISTGSFDFVKKFPDRCVKTMQGLAKYKKNMNAEEYQRSLNYIYTTYKHVVGEGNINTNVTKVYTSLKTS